MSRDARSGVFRAKFESIPRFAPCVM
jgi:hypothetical protein